MHTATREQLAAAPHKHTPPTHPARAKHPATVCRQHHPSSMQLKHKQKLPRHTQPEHRRSIFQVQTPPHQQAHRRHQAAAELLSARESDNRPSTKPRHHLAATSLPEPCLPDALPSLPSTAAPCACPCVSSCCSCCCCCCLVFHATSLLSAAT